MRFPASVILALFLAAVSGMASDQPLLIEYSFGSVHGRSDVRVFADGTVDAVETICCPLFQRDGDMTPLSAEDLKMLKVAVDLSIDGPWSTFRLPTVFDAPTGDFYAYWRGHRVVVRRIQSLTSGPQDLQNQSHAAASLERWMRRRVLQKMPDLR